ncbi:MAG TPA: BON domain-containing protein, partial [Candidatus Angelobacter sp.]|nr:BON domain-containing protein [Candidatus Angelobacter sp.]
MTNPRKYIWLMLLSLFLALQGVGCTHKNNRSDIQVAADVQSRINSDDKVPDKMISINASNGVVTLAGKVSSDAARNAAGSDAGEVEGVRTVVNNLQIAPPVTADQPVETAPIKPSPISSAGNSAPPRPERVSARTPSRARDESGDDGYKGEPNNANADAPSGPVTPVPWTSPAKWAQAEEAPAPQPPPAPAAPQKIIVPAGTQLSIRMNDEVNSEKALVGDVFH